MMEVGGKDVRFSLFTRPPIKLGGVEHKYAAHSGSNQLRGVSLGEITGRRS